MTVDKLIERLERMRDQVGGGCEVRVTDGDDEYGFVVSSYPLDVPTADTEGGPGSVVLIDTTAAYPE